MEGRGRRAHACQWRNQQARKNKSWESDGYVLIEGPAVTLYDESGKHLGAKTLTAPPVEGDEFKVGQKDVLLDGQISMSDFFATVKGIPTASAATPARAVPGFFTRPGMLPSTSTPTASTSTAQTPRPASVARPPAAAPTSSIDTPVSAGKVWNEQKPKLQKPFKPLVPNSAAKRSPSMGESARTGTPGQSRLRERAEQVRTKSMEEDGEEEVKPVAAAWKGKARAKVVDSEEDEAENSPPKVDQTSSSPAKKRRRVDSVAAVQPAAVSKPARLSAADAAFEMALSRQSSTESKKRPPNRTVSLPSRLSTSTTIPSKPLVRKDSKDEAMDDVFLDTSGETEELADNLLEGIDDGSWGDDLGEEEGEKKPVVPAAGPSKAVAVPVKLKNPIRAPGTPAGSSGTRYFSCQWRKRTTKKQPVWEGDGILVVKGTKVELKDKEGGARLTGGTISATAKLENGDQLQVGNMVVELEDSIDEQTYLDGGPYDDSWKSSWGPAPVLKPFRPPAPAKAVNPLASRVAARSASPVVEPHPSPHETARFALPPALVPLPAKFKSPAFVKQPVVQTTPLKEQAKKSGPRFDPQREGAVVMRRPDEQHQKQYNTKNLPVVDVVIDPILGDKLRDHQKEGVAFMYECVMGMRTAGQGCILADDMGLGKTIQAITLIWTMLKQNPYQGDKTGVVDRAMIVCPVTLIKNWSQEIRKWLGRDRLRVYVADSQHPVRTFATSKNYDVLIVGYEKIRDCADDVKFAQPPVGLIICDEGHRLKSEKAKTTQALQSLSCMRRVILSGTPIQNNLGEFFAMMDFVNPGLFNDANYFKRSFEAPILASRQPNATAKAKKAGEEAFELLTSMQRNFVLRRTNEVILKHLPPKLEYTVFIRPTKLQVDLYAQVLSSSAVRSMLEGYEVAAGLALLQTVGKLANSPGLLFKHIEAKGLGQLDPSVKDIFPAGMDAADVALSGKFLLLAAMLAELRETTEEKIVVVSNFTATLDLIEAYCKRKKYPYCRLDGKTPQQDRIPMVDGFNRGSHKNNFVFLLSSKGGGTGLNIIGASRLVQIDSDWNPSNDLQAMARIHREGQKRTCVIYRFLTVGTIDEVIYQRQITKQDVSEAVMDAETKGRNTFTTAELRNLFTLHDDVACQTHELLGCRCHFGEIDEDEEDEPGSDESESEDDGGGFMQASQYQDGEAARQVKTKRRHLSALKTWTHYNCTDEASIDDIEDGLLRSAIYMRMGDSDEDDGVIEPQGNGTLILRRGQVGFVFGKKTGADEAAGPVGSSKAEE
ncbi:hypothetical protein NBRC10512_000312 [Rhodotorula toruloides]|uniref:RHTO0S11e00364g1_1 n=2 Tax=Rhodotorula toruloides TaxID=5286 RepID=A0A061BC39_RHOTO|nr:DNA repair and recombination protein RAD54B [Rhodotorula toruloides NP11]EMS19975.1 DNA repair and recombination protein RAD54B [Rhodotorula toruloides NP11]CDR45452.1 RHTO0S11e00364g1_1 [Rhodotorula toruloides]